VDVKAALPIIAAPSRSGIDGSTENFCQFRLDPSLNRDVLLRRGGEVDDVNGVGTRRAAPIGNACRDGLNPRGGSRQQGHHGAFPSLRFRDRATDSTAAARNDGDFANQMQTLPFP
jgi:hypothetical protein